jgi:hypothetical protein
MTPASPNDIHDPLPGKRTYPADLRTPTGVWHLTHGRYGRRKRGRKPDREYPWMWLIGYRAIGLAFYIAGALAAIYLSRRFGVNLP